MHMLNKCESLPCCPTVSPLTETGNTCPRVRVWSQWFRQVVLRGRGEGGVPMLGTGRL